MDRKYFLAIFPLIFTVGDPVLGLATITDVRLADGLTPNEGRVEYRILEPGSNTSTWKSSCGDGIRSDEASAICRQLGYPGFNNYIDQWPFGMVDLFTSYYLDCESMRDENLWECSLLTDSQCSKQGGVICFDRNYDGCFAYPGPASDDLKAPCEGDLQGLTISKCMDLCYNTNRKYAYAGLYKGITCLCGNASLIVSQFGDSDDRDCFSPCTGRDIETCGGPSHIALFNITQFVAGSSIQCANLTSSTISSDGSTTTTTNDASSTSSPQSSPSMTSNVPPTTGSMSSVIKPQPRTDSTTAPTTSEEISSTAEGLTNQRMMSQRTARPQSPTGTRRATGGRTSEPTEAPINLGLYIGVGAGAGIVVLIIIVLVVVFLFRWRRSRDKGYSEDHTILELRSRPEGSDMAMSPYPPKPSNTYSLENGHTNPLGPNGLNQGMEDSDYSMIPDTQTNPVNDAQNSYDYEPVPRPHNPSGSPPEPVPRRQVTANSKNLEKGQRDSFPKYAVSQKMRKEPIGQDITKAAPSSQDPDDVADLYAMPDKSKKSMKGSNGHMSGNVGGIDNALYICRDDENAKVDIEPSEYALEQDDAVVNSREEGDVDMIENDLYGT